MPLTLEQIDARIREMEAKNEDGKEAEAEVAEVQAELDALNERREVLQSKLDYLKRTGRATFRAKP